MPVDDFVAAQQHRPFDAVFQLPDVAGPVVGHEHVDGRGRDAPDVLVVLAAVLLDEIVRQKQDVGLALTQGGEVYREDVEPIVQVLAEAAPADQLFELEVGGRDQAYVDFDGGRTADPFELPLLEHPEELDLGGRRQVADLVEKQGAPVGQLEAALAARHRPGECPLLVAEQLALDDRFGQGGAVDLDQRLSRPQAVVVDGVGHQLLARTRLAADQDRGLAPGYLGDEVVDLLHGPGVADDVRRPKAVLELLGEAAVFLNQPLTLFLGGQTQLDRLGDHRGDDREQTHVLLQRGALRVGPIGAQGADDPVLQLDRHADVRDVSVGARDDRTGAVQKTRLFGHLGDDRRLSALKHLADHPLPDAVAAPALLLRGEPESRLDRDLPGFPVEQVQASPNDSLVAGNDLQDRTQGVPQVEAGVQGLADVEQHGQLLDLFVDVRLCACHRVLSSRSPDPTSW